MIKQWSRILPVIAMSLSISAPAQTPTEQHAVGASTQHEHAVDEHHDALTRVSHNDSFHHFRLWQNGGAIDLVANDAEKEENVARIREHLKGISQQFSAGDFSVPMMIHETVPAGVPGIKKYKSQITYTFENIPGGARIRIFTKNSKAIEAVHQFMLFQIKEHRTGDATTVTATLDVGKA